MIRNKHYKNKYLKITGSEIVYPYEIGEHIYNMTRTVEDYNFDQVETVESLASSSIYVVLQSDPPTINYDQRIEEATPILSGSVYIQDWIISSASLEEIDKTKQLRWRHIRNKRQTLLEESDWTQCQDSPITGSKLTEWQTYRQSLRDITNQDDPFSINWPTKPE